MIAYLDTSAFVPLLIDEPTTSYFYDFWERADRVLTTRLTYIAASSAIARAHRSGRVNNKGYQQAVAKRDVAWRAFEIIEIDELLMRRSAELAREFGLRRYDAVHCAAGELADDNEFIAASNDAALLAAWRELGLTTT
jgi:predicted nucleic acid-binding protein